MGTTTGLPTTAPLPLPDPGPGGTEVTDASGRSGTGDALAILATSARLVRRHWPALLAAALIGIGGHNRLANLAVVAAHLNVFLGMLVLLMGPGALFGSWVVMLRLTRASLPGNDPRAAGPDRRRRPAGSTGALIALVAVYQASGDLRQDIFAFVNDTAWTVNPFSANASGQYAALDPVSASQGSRLLWGIVLVAVAGRWLLGRAFRPGRRGRSWLAVPLMYLELVWIVLGVALVLGGLIGTAQDWVGSRVAVVRATEVWAATMDDLDHFGPVGAALRTALGRLTEGLTSADLVIVVPLAWLAVATMVLGGARHEAHDERPGPRLRRLAARGRVAAYLTEHGYRIWRDRFGALSDAVRQLLRNGLTPTLTVCLGVLAFRLIPDLLWQLERELVGPLEFEDWHNLSYILSPLNSAVSTVATMCLLAAAADRLGQIEPRPAPEPEAGAEPQPEAGAEPQPEAGAEPQPRSGHQPAEVPANPWFADQGGSSRA